jgi:3-oxoacyl-[acyl-carrier-protein] synthase II
VTAGRRSVVITGRGAICALGDHPARIFEGLCEGRRPFAAPTLFPASVAPEAAVAEVRDFAPQNYLKTGNVRPLDRTGRLSLVAAELALADGGWPIDARLECPLGLILGTMFCSVRTIGEFDRRALQAGPQYVSPLDFSNTVLNAAAGQVAIWQKLRGVNATIAAGATSGLHAIGYGSQLIERGRVDALVAGGAEEICYESFYGFRQAGRLAPRSSDGGWHATPFDADRQGTLMGEGAAFLVLESEQAARARRAPVLGRIIGFGSAYDPLMEDRHSNRPGALATAIRRALADGGVEPHEIGLVSASASGSPVLDAWEAAGIAAAVGHAVPVTAIKSMTGEALGASGALQVLAAVESLRSGRLPGVAGLAALDSNIALDVVPDTRAVPVSRALVTSIAPEGNCCAMILATD